MLSNLARSHWAESRAPGAPPRAWWDRALAAALGSAVLLEVALRDDMVWRPASLLFVALAFLLPWRRAHPLVVVVAAFVPCAALDLAALATGVTWEGPFTAIFMVLFPYALFRWGSGREATIGLAVIGVPVVLSGLPDGNLVGDTVGGALVVLLAAAVGASVRYRTSSRIRAIDQVRLREREQLARELHDTVAHHVSAIAIQAQAGRTLSATRPEAAVDAVAVIEQEASRTLTEMRAMVGALRSNEEGGLAPQRGLADLDALGNGHRPAVRVERSGDLDDLAPAVGTALYRIAQEAITNAVRHARHATRIDIAVSGDDGEVTLQVTDDGDPVTGPPGTGYGLVGMGERVKILGGSFTAGPSRNRGWTVEAVLPRRGTRR